MTIPGVGAVTALAYRATIDVPARFRNSKAVGAVLGLTPAQHQSGEMSRVGRISLCGDGMMRALLYESAQTVITAVQCQMVMAQGLGHEDRQEPRVEKGNRGAGAQARCHHAPHLG
jgi:hypothetical protein